MPRKKSKAKGPPIPPIPKRIRKSPEGDVATFEVHLKMRSGGEKTPPKRVTVAATSPAEAVATGKRFALASEYVVLVRQVRPERGPDIPVIDGKLALDLTEDPDPEVPAP